MDSGHRREPSGSSPSRTPSSPSRHSVKLSIRSLIDSSRVGEDGFDAEGFSFTRSPRHSPQWEGQAEEEREEEAEEEHEGEPIGDANSDEDESMTAMANGQTSLAAASSLLPPMDVGTIIATNSRTHPSLTVRLTLEEPSVEEPTSRPRLRRRRSSTSNTEPGDDKERRKSLRLSRPSSAVEVRIGGKESSSPPIPVTHPQRIRLRSPKRRSPSPRRQGSSTDNLHITSNKRPRMTVQEGASEGEATPRARRSPSPSRKASSLSPSVAGNERRARRRSRSPLRASTEVVPSSSLRSSPMRGTRAESAARVSPKRTSSPSRVNTAAASEVGGSANKIRIRLRPSLEASSTESVNGGTGGGGETVVTRSRKATSDDAIDPKRRSPPKERRPPKRSSSPKGKNGAREASTRKSNRRTSLSRNSDEASPPSGKALKRTTRESPRQSPSRKGKAVATTMTVTAETGSYELPSPSRASKLGGDSTTNQGASMTMTVLESPTRAKDHLDPSAPPSSPRSLVNNEFCSACSGAGTLICCESCPRSFHFLCADPPIDPENVPDENWFCDECRWARLEPSLSQEGGGKLGASVPRELWTRLRDYVMRLNPKIFILPKRIRKMASEEEGGRTSLAAELGGDSSKNLVGNPDNVDADPSNPSLSHHSHNHHHHHHLHKERLAGKGYCHHCGQGAAMEENKLLINCDDCTLKWHLDCLPYPLAVYPSGHRHWACPVHLTRNNLAHLPPNTVQQILDRTRETTIKITDWPERPLPRTDLSILPEATVRLQFGWSTIGSTVGGQLHASSNYEGCRVPEVVREAYLQMRTTSAHEAKLLRYYETYDYTDRAMETNMVI